MATINTNVTRPVFEILFILIIATISTTACAQSNTMKLEGKWMNTANQGDTLTFLLVGDRPVLEVDRGTDVWRSSSRPKIGSGSYSYILKEGVISLLWSLSSSAMWNDYFFTQHDDTIVIENFYDATRRGVKETFRRLN